MYVFWVYTYGSQCEGLGSFEPKEYLAMSEDILLLQLRECATDI